MATNKKQGLAEAGFRKAKPDLKPWEETYSQLAQKTERLRAQRMAKALQDDAADEGDEASTENPEQAQEKE